MIWASLRLQRLQLLTLLGTLVVGVGVIVLLRSNMIDAINSSQLAQCVTRAIEECAAPAGAQKAFRAEWSTPLETAQLLIIGLPALIGVFIGAPLFALELEQGTHVLAFTQSVGRTRWMFSKLVVALVPALVVLVVLQQLVGAWLEAAGTLGPLLNGPFNRVNFAIQDVSPVGYALFAFALGTFLGAMARRTLVAMTAGLAAFVVVRFTLSGMVNSLVPAERREAPVGSSENLRENDLVLESGWLDASGQAVPYDKAVALNQACKSTPPGSGTASTQEEFLACLPKSGLARKYALVIPESQAWQVHLVDVAIFGVLAVLLLAGTAWALRRQS
jgi:ABC-type transport system involved in multi-copper enzyme maturation permease subunit